MKKIDYPVLFFIAVSFFISQFPSFFNDVKSDREIFYQTSGDVEWWLNLVCYKVQIVWLAAFAIYLGLRKQRLSVKVGIQTGIYFFTAIKDIYDWFDNANTGTKYVDWIITIGLLLAFEILWNLPIAKRIFNGNR